MQLQQLLQQGLVWQGQQQQQHHQQQFLDSGWAELNQHLGGGWLRVVGGGAGVGARVCRWQRKGVGGIMARCAR